MTRDEAINRILGIERSTHIHTRDDARDFEALEMAIEALEQEPKTGQWRVDIDKSRGCDWRRFYCSECGNWQTYGTTRFRPFCGARMESEEQE